MRVVNHCANCDWIGLGPNAETATSCPMCGEGVEPLVDHLVNLAQTVVALTQKSDALEARIETLEG